MQLCVLQLTSTDDVEFNIQQLFEALESVPEKTQLVCTPENTLFLRLSNNDHPGFGFDLSEEVFSNLRKHCETRQRKILLGSVPVKEDGGVYNASVLVTPSSCDVVYRKMHLFDVDVEGEKPQRESDQFLHGKDPAIIEVDGWKIGLSICYDLRFPELYSKYAQESVDLILVPAAFLVPTGRAHWHILLRARAIENQCYVVAPGQGGLHKSEQSGKTRETFGHSLIIDPWGRIVGEAKEPGRAILQAQLEKEALAQVRAQIPMSNHRHTKLWS